MADSENGLDATQALARAAPSVQTKEQRPDLWSAFDAAALAARFRAAAAVMRATSPRELPTEQCEANR